MDLFAEFATDEKLEVEGRWVPINDKTSFKIARAHNPHFNRMFQRLYEANKTVIKSKGDLAEETANRMLGEVMASTILVDWKGPVSIKGKDLGTYSKAAAQEALQLKEFRAWVQGHADDAAAFKAVQDEEDAKN